MGWLSNLSFKSVGNFISKNVKSAAKDIAKVAPQALKVVGNVAGNFIGMPKLGDTLSGLTEKAQNVASVVTKIMPQGPPSTANPLFPLNSNAPLLPSVLSSQGQQDTQQSQKETQEKSNNTMLFLILGVIAFLTMGKNKLIRI